MSKGIDYSKWDKMVADMSDSENEDDPYLAQSFADKFINENDKPTYDEDLSSGPAKVTRLKQPSSVTIGPQGATISPNGINPKSSISNGSKSEIVSTTSVSSKLTKSAANIMDKSSKSLRHDSTPTLIPRQISVALSSLITKWTHNGGVHNFDYLWSQTADELVIRFLVPMATRSKCVEIKFDAESKAFWCNIKVSGREWTLKKTFCRKLKASEEEDAGMDWTLCDVPVFNWDHSTLKDTMNAILGENVEQKEQEKEFVKYAQRLSECRFLKVTLEKERINNRIIEWWDMVFEGDMKIDLEQRIKDRKTDPKKMKDIWKMTHDQFKKDVAKIEPQEIVVPDEEGESDDDDETIDID